MASLLDLAQARLQGLLDIPTRVGRAVVNPTLFSGLLGAPTLPKETGMAQAAYGLPAQPNMSVLDPEQRAYLEGYAQGEPYSYLGMAAPFAAPAVTAGAKAVAPKAGMALENYMASQGLLQPLTAYHGTPHTIRGQFDISKVGTGEGNQTFGYGMYFAENPAVAKTYQAALSNTKYKVGERELKGNEAWAAQFLHDFQGDALPKRIDADTAIQKANEILKDTETKKEIIENIKKLDKSGVNVENGNLYKVDIPDEYIPNMLDWDKPINKQSELVQNTAKELLPKIKQVSPWLDINKMTGQDFYRAYQRYRGNYPDFASEGLSEFGIKGIRYLDEGSRYDFKYSGDPAFIYAGNSFKESGYTAQEALAGMKKAYKNEDPKELELAINNVYGIEPKKTSNFVIFDPKDVKILEKNNQKVEGLLE
jgi:hypothetical protein